MEHTTITEPSILSTIWTIGWLFSIGYLQLSFWKGVKALIVWPYYIGVKYRELTTSKTDIS